MLAPESLPVKAFEVVHRYRKGKFFSAEVRMVTIAEVLAFDRCLGVDDAGSEFVAELSVFYPTCMEADAAALADMSRLLPA